MNSYKIDTMTTNHLRRIFAAMLLLLALCGLGACRFHEVEEIEVIHAPEGDGTIVVPDWDDTKR